MEASSRLLRIATVPLFLNTACVCGSEKNYRLQDIQLSKSSLKADLKIGSPKQFKVVVENTGLEPVTSWLQTRRSPS
jgi:hypothetical protein